MAGGRGEAVAVRGWIKLWRSALHTPCLDDCEELGAWVRLLLLADPNSGTLTTTRSEIASEWGCSRSAARSRLDRWESEGMILRECSGRGRSRQTVITVTEWSQYQSAQLAPNKRPNSAQKTEAITGAYEQSRPISAQLAPNKRPISDPPNTRKPQENQGVDPGGTQLAKRRKKEEGTKSARARARVGGWPEVEGERWPPLSRAGRGRDHDYPGLYRRLWAWYSTQIRAIDPDAEPGSKGSAYAAIRSLIASGTLDWPDVRTVATRYVAQIRRTGHRAAHLSTIYGPRDRRWETLLDGDPPAVSSLGGAPSAWGDLPPEIRSRLRPALARIAGRRLDRSPLDDEGRPGTDEAAEIYASLDPERRADLLRSARGE